MKALLQRVNWANVVVAGSEVGAIQEGLLVLVGFRHGDGAIDLERIADKCCQLRIFSDEAGKMNLDIQQMKGSFLIVSQFTLYADCQKGRRPAFTDAAEPGVAKKLYLQFCDLIRQRGFPVETGEFGADMIVSSQNNGPVTILLQSEMK